MATDFTIKRGDRLPEIGSILKDADDVVVNLTGCTVLFIMKNKATAEVVITEPADIIGAATAGTVHYAWAEGDTDVEGTYQGEWEVTFPDGRPETFPNNRYIQIKIVVDLGGDAPVV